MPAYGPDLPGQCHKFLVSDILPFRYFDGLSWSQDALNFLDNATRRDRPDVSAVVKDVDAKGRFLCEVRRHG